MAIAPRPALSACRPSWFLVTCLCALLSASPRSKASELRRTAIVRAVAGARNSIVNIHGQKTLNASFDEFGNPESSRQVNGMGTGVVIDTRGYILTNHHVVQGVRRIHVTLASGKTYFARLISYDPKTDLAVIKIDAGRRLPVIKVGTSSDLMTGEEVIAVGNAYGYEHTVTRGIISALHRTVQVSDTQQYEDLIQTDASINPGNSGGPLLNIDGEMIGVNVAVRAGAQGIGFAIPVNRALEVAGRLLSIRRVDQHWHGLKTKPADPAERGLAVSKVEDGSPASKGGLQPGDVITQIGEHHVNHLLDLERALLGRSSEEELEVTVIRDNRPTKLSMLLGRPPSLPDKEEDPAWKVLGLRVAKISREEFERLNSRYRGGLRILDVREAGPAAKQGIRPGDVLVGMHIWETVSPDNLMYILNRQDLQDIEPLKFYILRGEETLFGHLPLATALR